MTTIAPQTMTDAVGKNQLSPLLEHGLVYRHGVLVNFEELAAWVHLPGMDVIEELKPVNLRCEPLMPECPPEISGEKPPDHPYDQGIRIGHYIDGDRRIDVVIPPGKRSRHAHILGRNGVGKSTLIQSMLLDDVARGDGARGSSQTVEATGRFLESKRVVVSESVRA